MLPLAFTHMVHDKPSIVVDFSSATRYQTWVLREDLPLELAEQGLNLGQTCHVQRRGHYCELPQAGTHDRRVAELVEAWLVTQPALDAAVWVSDQPTHSVTDVISLVQRDAAARTFVRQQCPRLFTDKVVMAAEDNSQSVVFGQQQ